MGNVIRRDFHEKESQKEVPKTRQTLSQDAYQIGTEDDIVVMRQRVRALALEEGFDSFAVAALTTAASELGRNIWAHAGSGVVEIESFREAERIGIQMRFSDEGPGIGDIERVLTGGFSTARSLGLGLSGSKRLVDEFDIKSTVGKGTLVTVTKWNRVY